MLPPDFLTSDAHRGARVNLTTSTIPALTTFRLKEVTAIVHALNQIRKWRI